MQYKSVKGLSGSSQLGTLLILAGAGLIVSVIFQLVFSLTLLPKGTDLSNLEYELMKALKNPKHVQSLQIMQIVSTLLIMCIPALWYNYICHGKKCNGLALTSISMLYKSFWDF